MRAITTLALVVWSLATASLCRRKMVVHENNQIDPFRSQGGLQLGKKSSVMISRVTQPSSIIGTVPFCDFHGQRWRRNMGRAVQRIQGDVGKGEDRLAKASKSRNADRCEPKYVRRTVTVSWPVAAVAGSARKLRFSATHPSSKADVRFVRCHGL
jgi:hypothetical protein